MKKRSLLIMIVALLMVFAMMPMTAGTVFAIDADITPPKIDVSSLQVTLPEGKTEGTVQVTSAAGRTVVYTKAPSQGRQQGTEQKIHQEI